VAGIAFREEASMRNATRVLLLVVLLLGAAEGCHKKGRGPYFAPSPAHAR
jgi:hypothetical protein